MLTCAYPPIFIHPALRSEIALTRLFYQSCHTPFFASISPPPSPLVPNVESRLCPLLTKSVSLRAKHFCPAPCHLLSQSLVLVPPFSTRPLSLRQSPHFAPPPDRRVRQSLALGRVAGYSAALSGSRRRRVEAEVAALSRWSRKEPGLQPEWSGCQPRSRRGRGAILRP